MTVPQRLHFSAQLSDCNPATCWHIDLSILVLLHHSISIHFRKSFSCCMKFFQKNDPWAGLGRILHNHRKTLMSSVHLCLFSWEGFPRQTCINQVSKTWMQFGPSWLFHKGCISLHSCQTAILPHVGTLNTAYLAFSFIGASIKFIQQFFCTSFGTSFCHGNEHRGLDPNMLSSGHHESWLFHKGCVSLHSCQTAMLPHVALLNSAYWAFSTFQSEFGPK